ncbi:beta-defensin 103-like [Carlito syrichta]|uniref:Beta-defensin 103-like n=1 Tax=Carlito syrichta TaxID=1868482 RepID=A0A3Q0EA65_CARSF|nr:beta-defensin 103-like [Carlito syrichta]
MRIYYLLFALFFLFVMPVPGTGWIIRSIQRYFCQTRGGRCAIFSCLPREEQIGHCSIRGQKCCRRIFKNPKT